ncbi:WHEP-TRS domain [Rhizoctonia solani]|uniref:histidine--tRNA ligase n=1 Tax=Rhizoctonia solani TaxID=456999 RepID=A0A8H7M5W4_9AGAM|nr:WHEP-TRS domain [Rhizoctonia solani]
MASTPDLAALRANITALNEHIHTLKSTKEAAWPAGGAAKGDSKKDNKLALKTPKGTRDWSPLEMSIREHIFSTLQRVFKAHGGVTIDTPVFELRDILTGKYVPMNISTTAGLDNDSQVPFARFLAMNGTTYPTIKRYHIAKVYRRDAPAMTKGRMREFYQCDFDIAGLYDPMVPDAEVLCILSEALTALDIKDFTIKINHRKILDGIFGLCGVPVDKTRSISSAVDKLDKLPWADVKKEMVEEKGLPEEVADKIGEYPTRFKRKRQSRHGDMELLFKYLNVFGITHQSKALLPAASNTSALPSTSASTPTTAKPAPKSKPKKSKPKNEDDEEDIDESQVGVGSIAAGGRYDDLVGMFASAAAGKASASGSGSGSGARAGRFRREKERGRSKATEVFVVSVGEGLIEERMRLAKELWDVGIKAEYMYKITPRLDAQFKVMDKELIPYAVMLGPDEVKEGKVKVKIQASGSFFYSAGGEDAGSQVTISREELIPWLKQRLDN